MNNKNSGNTDDVSSEKRSIMGFADELNKELDRLNFPESPRRTAALAAATDLDRTLIYRLLKSEGGASISTLAALRSIGVSIDWIFDCLQGRPGRKVTLKIGSCLIDANIQTTSAERTSVFLGESSPGVYELRMIGIGESPPPEALMVYSLNFENKKTIAVVDDDEDALTLLRDQLKEKFKVASFPAAKSLLESTIKLNEFDLFLVDWRLPDIDGEEFVKLIRSQTKAPIFILTGDTSASESIARTLDLPSVHHVAKPASIPILVKRLIQSL